MVKAIIGLQSDSSGCAFSIAYLFMDTVGLRYKKDFSGTSWTTISLSIEIRRRAEEVWSISHTLEQVLCAENGTNRPLASHFRG
jgi:hypothetical protein